MGGELKETAAVETIWPPPPPSAKPSPPPSAPSPPPSASPMPPPPSASPTPPPPSASPAPPPSASPTPPPSASPTPPPSASPTPPPSASPTPPPPTPPSPTPPPPTPPWEAFTGPFDDYDNKDYECHSDLGTEEFARASCEADPSCVAIHDYGCDGANWRYCTEVTPGGDRKACVYLKTEPSPPPPTPLEEEEAVSTGGSGRRLEQMCAENEAVTVTFTIEVEPTTATGPGWRRSLRPRRPTTRAARHASRRPWREKN